MLQNRGRFSLACIPTAETSQSRLSVRPSVCSVPCVWSNPPTASMFTSTPPPPCVTHLGSPAACVMLPCLLCLYPMWSVTFFAALHTNLKCFHRKAEMRPSHLLPFQKLGVVLVSQFASVGSGSQVFAVTFFNEKFLFRTPVSTVTNYLKYLKVLVLFGFVLLCFTFRPGAEVKLRVGFPSEFLLGRRQTHFTNRSTLTSAVSVTGSCQSVSCCACFS